LSARSGGSSVRGLPLAREKSQPASELGFGILLRMYARVSVIQRVDGKGQREDSCPHDVVFSEQGGGRYRPPRPSFDPSILNQSPTEWEMVCDSSRPHQALGYLTPKTVPRPLPPDERREYNRVTRSSRIGWRWTGSWLDLDVVTILSITR